MKKIWSVTCLLSLSVILHSQSLHLFGDSLVKFKAGFIGQVINQGIYSYINTFATDGNGYELSTIIKVDTSGKTIWSATPVNYIVSGLDPEKISFSRFIAGSDNDFYVSMNNGRIGKMRASSGSIDWLVPVTPLLGSIATLVDYSPQAVLFVNTTSISSVVRLNRYNKAKGQNEGYVDLRCPAQGVFNISVAPNGNIFLASRDSCYKYTSFDNPTFEWGVRTYTGAASGRYRQIDNMSLEGNNLFIFGNKEQGFHNGMISCIDITSGTLKWFQRNGGSFDLAHAAHTIKNGNLYTSWRHIYVGSITEQCFINKIDINTGTKAWEFNHNVQTQSAIYTEEQAMLSLVIDDNETIFLAGYGHQEDQTSTSLSFLKLRGIDGAVIQRSFIPGSGQDAVDYPGGITIKLINGKLYTTGMMPGNASGARLDTASLSPEKVNLYSAPIQYVSSVVGMKNLSRNKKAMVKKVGKRLRVEVTDPYFNRIWQQTIGDTNYQYDGFERFDALGISDSATAVTVAVSKYPYSVNHFYFAPTGRPQFLYFLRFDSTGKNTNSDFYNSDVLVRQPYQFFQDSLHRSWIVHTVGAFGYSDLLGMVFPGNDYVGMAAYSYLADRPYQLIRPTTYFAYARDTVLSFGEPGFYGGRPLVKKTWGEHNFNNVRYWFFPTYSIKWFNSAERETKDLYYVSARDSSLNDLVFKYRVSDSSVLWSKLESPAYVTIKGYELNGSFYALRTNGNAFLLQKYNGSNGNTIWSKTIPVPPGNVLTPGDFAMSKLRHNITVAGAIEDTLVKNMTKVFIIMYDTSGNELHSLIKDGYKSWQNKAISITIGQDGQTLVSGQISDSTHGYAGFIYEVDSTSLSVEMEVPKIADIIASVCSSTSSQNARLLNPVAAPYTISITMDNTISIPFNPADSTFRYSIPNAGNHTIRVTYSYKNSSSSKDSSFIVKATPPAGNTPSLAGNLLTAPATGTAYQWYKNASLISGATGQTYVITQNGTYSYTYAVNGCVSPISASLDAAVTSIVDPTNNNAIITIYPNPTSGTLNIHNLSSSYDYVVKIVDQNGKLVYGPVSLPRSNNYTMHLEKLLPGNYVLQLWNLSKKVGVGSQQIIIVK